MYYINSKAIQVEAIWLLCCITNINICQIARLTVFRTKSIIILHNGGFAEGVFHMEAEEKARIMKNMIDNLSILRSKLNISQEQLAGLLGVTRQTISSFESGQRKMTWSVFLALVLIFFRNEPTKNLLVALDIYTPALNSYLNVSKHDGGN